MTHFSGDDSALQLPHPTMNNTSEGPVECVDIHTHIIPETWPNWAEKFGPLTDFLTIQKTSKVNHSINLFLKKFSDDCPFRP